MDPGSRTVPSLPTITLPLSPTPSPLSSAPTPIPSPLNLTSQNTIMSGVVRNKAGAGAQPPRPPNAWILYRSDKLQELPPPPLGYPKPTQAEVSKIISAQWRKETEEVRALYEQRAEMAKAEHARLYPNYRFAPIKKADKDRIREEKRQAKEQERVGRRVRGRVAPYPPPSTAPAFKASVPFSIKHVFPNTPSASPPSSSASSPSSTTPPSQPCVGVVPCYDSARVTPDASIDPQLPPVDSQIPSSRETSHFKVTVPVVTPLPAVPPRLTLNSPRPSPPKGWQPSSSGSLTTFPSPPEEISLPVWLQTLPQSTQVQHQTANLHFTMPSFDPLSLQDTRNESPLAGFFTSKLSGDFPLHDFVNETLIAPPSGSIDVDMGIYPPSMCESSTFDNPIHLLGDNSEAFMLSPTFEQLLANINALAQPQPQDSTSPLSSSDSTSIDPTQDFNFDDFVKDFVLTAPQELIIDDALTTEARVGDQNINVALSIPQNSSAPLSLHSVSVASPTPSFYVTTPSPASTEPTPPPVVKQPYVPPRGAANASARRVGGSWAIPVAVSRLASPIPSCTPSPNQVVA